MPLIILLNKHVEISQHQDNIVDGIQSPQFVFNNHSQPHMNALILQIQINHFVLPMNKILINGLLLLPFVHIIPLLKHVQYL